MNTDYAYNTAAVFCYIIRNNQVLLIKRTAPPEAGKYTVVGGRKERGEDLTAACKREVLEETGLAVGSVTFRGTVSIAAEGAGHETLAFYFATRDFTGEPEASAEGSLEWCGIDESFSKEGISSYYARISPYVFDEDRCFLGSMRVSGSGEIESLNML